MMEQCVGLKETNAFVQLLVTASASLQAEFALLHDELLITQSVQKNQYYQEGTLTGPLPNCRRARGYQTKILCWHDKHTHTLLPMQVPRLLLCCHRDDRSTPRMLLLQTGQGGMQRFRSAASSTGCDNDCMHAEEMLLLQVRLRKGLT